MKKLFIRIQCILGLSAMLLSSFVLPAQAQSSPSNITATTNASPLLDISNQTDGVSVSWSVSSSDAGEIQAASMNAAVSSLTTMRYGGYDLPMQLQTVLLPDNAKAETRVDQVASMPWRSAIRVSEALSPNALGWEDEYEPVTEEMRLPSEPLFILREGRVRGQRVAVVAFSPIYETNGEVKMAHNMQAKVPNGEVINGGLGELMSQVQSSKALRAASFDPMAPALYAPTNPAAAQTAVKITVTDLGIQEMTGADLSNAGISAGTPLSKIQVAYEGTEIALDINDVAGNGVLDNDDTVRFYAMPKEHSQIAGDYWNDFDVYWLTAPATGPNGKRMLNRSVVPASGSNAPIRTTGIEKGIWEDNAKLESTMSGVDNDYWFAGSLSSDSSMLGSPNLYPSTTIELNNKLPLASNSILSKFELTGASRTVTTHKLDVSIGNTTEELEWTNLQYYENWSEVITTTTHSSQLKLTLRPGVNKSSIRYDKIYWEQPVNLEFANKGATFSGIENIWRYGMSDVPADAVLYDISDPMVPVELTIPTIVPNTTTFIEDGPKDKDYILTGDGTLHKPLLTAHAPVIFSANDAADTIYIAPANFHDELQPLVAHRQAQGYTVKVVDVEDIYDAWSFGVASPNAIRRLLQFAVNNWSPAPIAAVLAGDTTADPRNNFGNMNGTENKNIIPAFLERVDPWIGRTACEVCMAQLDGDEPFSPEDPDTLIDIWVGRLSAQNETHVTDIVDKILSYETAVDLNNPASWTSPTDTWRGKSAYISEEHISIQCVADSAGDFALFSDEIIKNWQSNTMEVERIYYDPRPLTDPATCEYHAPTVDPWRVVDAVDVRNRTIQAFNNGAGLITSNTHSNHYQWGSTDNTNNSQPYLMGFNDIFGLQNGDRLPVLFELTCYTAQFTLATSSPSTGTVMDERFQRQPNGGAVAIFGPSGLTVAYGHDWLAAGAHEYLWEEVDTYQGTFGEMLEHAYMKLFTDGSCCQDARMTFLGLGDPLMPMLINDRPETYLPVMEQGQ